MKYCIKPLTLALTAVCGLSAMAADRFVISGSIPGVNDSIRVVLMNVEREKAEKSPRRSAPTARLELQGQ